MNILRNILFATALFASATVMAQKASETPVINHTSVMTTAQKAQQKAPEGAYRWGYTDADNFSALGNSKTGVFGVAIKVPGTGFLNGAKIVSVNLPVYFKDMKSVSVWGSKNLAKDDKVFSKDVTTALKEGYNEITLDAPYTVDGDLYVGYTFTIDDVTDTKATHPIGKVDGKADGSMFLNLNGSFVDYSTSGYGMSALQIYLTGVQQDDYNAVFEYKKALFTVKDTENSIPMTIFSNGKNAVESIEYTTEVNGKTTTYTSAVAIPGGFKQRVAFLATIPSPSEIETYNVKMVITKVNGAENANPQPLYITGDNVTRKATHKVLVEEFTGTNCGWCPRGWVGMEAIKAQQSDIAVPIAVHQYNTTDPMYLDFSAYAPLPVIGAPSSCINRNAGIDPYYGTSTADGTGNDGKALGIMDDVADAAGDITPISVHVLGEYNEEKTQVTAHLDLEFLSNSGTYTVEYVLTADALKGTASSWRQANYYYQKEASTLVSDEELEKFCVGGAYGKEKVFLTFNDVALASSYVNNVNTAGELPWDFVAGDKYTESFVLTMPTKSVLKNAIKYDQVYINALVFDESGYCVNATRSRVMTQEEYAVGITTVENEAAAKASATFNTLGQRVGDNAKGIVIRGGKKYIK